MRLASDFNHIVVPGWQINMSNRFSIRQRPKRISSDLIYSLLNETKDSASDLIFSTLDISKPNDNILDFKSKRLTHVGAPEELSDAINLGEAIDIIQVTNEKKANEIKQMFEVKLRENLKAMEKTGKILEEKVKKIEKMLDQHMLFSKLIEEKVNRLHKPPPKNT